jgi:hypothetical protein
MRPHVDGTGFGWLTIEGERYEHDVLIRMGGKVKRRKKKLSKRVYGTSHTISLDEARHVFEEGATRLIVGSGQYGQVHLSREAEDYFHEHGCSVQLLPTPEALEVWNQARGDVIGLFHVTC